MTAKNPHSTSSVRDQWAAQRMAPRKGGEAIPTVIPGFGEALEAPAAPVRQAKPTPANAPKPSEVAANVSAAPSAGQDAQVGEKPAAPARPASPAVPVAKSAATQGGVVSAKPLPQNPMIAARMRQEQARTAREQAQAKASAHQAVAHPAAAPQGQRALKQHLETMSPQARQYSRYEVGRYEPGSAAASTGSFAPAEGVLPFVLYGVISAAVTLVWCAWTRMSLDGSVMGSSAHFSAGLVIFTLILAAGVVLGTVVSVLSRRKGNMPVSTAIALSFGKTAIAMLLAVVVWFVAMLVAAG